MRDPRKVPFEKYLRETADILGLRDWTVGIDHGPLSVPDRLAEADTRRGRKILWVTLSEAFLDSAPDRQRQTIVHELLHAHHSHLQFLISDNLNESAAGVFTLALEYAIDGIAEEWAKLLPLPPTQPMNRKKPA